MYRYGDTIDVHYHDHDSTAPYVRSTRTYPIIKFMAECLELGPNFEGEPIVEPITVAKIGIKFFALLLLELICV